MFFGWVALAAMGGDPAGLDLFLRLDPLIALGTLAAGRTWAWPLLPAGLVMLATPFFGRLFCGYLCPMGALVDLGERLGGRPRTGPRPADGFGWIKYALLAWIMAAAVLGVSFVFLASPLSLVTRAAALAAYPILALTAWAGLPAVHALAGLINVPDWTLIQVRVPRFEATQFFILFFFILVFWAGQKGSRFWCRHLCPAGGLLAFLSARPIWKRTVSEACTACGACVKACPMAAIDSGQPKAARFRECLVCRTCEKVCPVRAVSFPSHPRPALPASVPASGSAPVSNTSSVDIPRRRVLLGALGGAVSAAVAHAGPLPAMTGILKPPNQTDLIRPPGALPEWDFLALCVRCGECLAACPTGVLQPVWFQSGPLGLFSPRIAPWMGYCDPSCRRCGQVCPTGALRLLEPADRIWAKTGTAVIDRRRCLAWEEGKSCLVCDEVCPYDAVDFHMEPGLAVAAPHVAEDRCSGCGACQRFCPVIGRSAIYVTPAGEMRLTQGSYQAEARTRGLMLQLRSAAPAPPAPPAAGPAPGFDVDL